MSIYYISIVAKENIGKKKKIKMLVNFLVFKFYQLCSDVIDQMSFTCTKLVQRMFNLNGKTLNLI